MLSAAILKSDSEKLMGYTSHVDLSSQPPNYPNLLMHNETFTDPGEPNSGHVWFIPKQHYYKNCYYVCYWLGKTQCCDVFLGVCSYKTHWCRISVLYFFLSGELLVYYIIVLQNNIIKWTLQNWLKGSTCELFVVNFFYLDV